jgi:hypothetical protein
VKEKTTRDDMGPSIRRHCGQTPDARSNDALLRQGEVAVKSTVVDLAEVDICH